jgi:hypothetical protein
MENSVNAALEIDIGVDLDELNSGKYLLQLLSAKIEANPAVELDRLFVIGELKRKRYASVYAEEQTSSLGDTKSKAAAREVGDEGFFARPYSLNLIFLFSVNAQGKFDGVIF